MLSQLLGPKVRSTETLATDHVTYYLQSSYQDTVYSIQYVVDLLFCIEMSVFLDAQD